MRQKLSHLIPKITENSLYIVKIDWKQECDQGEAETGDSRGPKGLGTMKILVRASNILLLGEKGGSEAEGSKHITDYITAKNKGSAGSAKPLFLLVGATGFEPATTRSHSLSINSFSAFR